MACFYTDTHGDRLPLLHRGNIKFGRGQSQDVLRGTHGCDELEGADADRVEGSVVFGGFEISLYSGRFTLIRDSTSQADSGAAA